MLPCAIGRTSCSGTRGGPAAMSAALVPGCILLRELASMKLCSNCAVCVSIVALPEGDLGPNWISACGGGLGSLGELGAMAMMGERLRFGKTEVSRGSDIARRIPTHFATFE